MKKLMLSLAAMVSLTVATAQNDLKKTSGFAVQFTLNDFKTPISLRSGGAAAAIGDEDWKNVKEMSPGIALSYLQGLSDHIDFAGTLSGSFSNVPVPNKPVNSNRYLLLEAAATANLKLLTDDYFFTPFLTLGAGASKFRGYFSAFIPVGVGLQFNLGPESFLLINSQYRIPVTDNGAYNLYHAIGFAQTMERKEPQIAAAPPLPVVLDRDNDGVPDVTDKCPDVPGLANLMGCPDKDGDGIADGEDKCPDVAGIAKYGGCPIPDTDGDGINDENDKCPTVKGVARYQGCPIPDQDNDGVNDEEDKCPTRPGPVSNQGCPEISKEVVEKINIAAKNVFFSTGSSKLLAKSNKSLDEVINLLSADQSLKLAIDGHTDNTGNAEKNQILSEARANSVKAYLVSKGVDESRLTATGYGIDKPVADNKTAAGRAQNRRVEITASNF